MLFWLFIACNTNIKGQSVTTNVQNQDTNEPSEPSVSPTSEPNTPSSEPTQSPTSEPAEEQNNDTQTDDTNPNEPSQPTIEPSTPEPTTCYSSNRISSDILLPDESSFGTSETVSQNGFTDDYLYDATNYIKIGVRRDWGGSIIFFGLSNGSTGMNNTNTIDANDTGREVQVAFYDLDRIRQGCAYNATCATNLGSCPNSITYLGWNPVQGGNRCNNGSPITSISNQNGRLELVVQPLHWNPNWNNVDCDSSGCSNPNLAYLQSDVQLTQRLRFVRTHVVELQYTLEELAGLDHARNLQELPTVYAANGNNGPDLWRLMDADGNQINIDIPANDGFYYRDFTSSSPWTTLQNDTLTYGVGILYENGLLEYQGWQNRSLPFNNVRSKIQFGISAYGSIHARAYLLLGSFHTIQSEANIMMSILPPFGYLDTPVHESVVQGSTLQIQGWALDNRGIQSITAIIDETEAYQISYGSTRQDVCSVWPGYQDCDNVGFEGNIDISYLPTAPGCAHQIEIQAIDTDGNARIISRDLFYLP